MVPKLRFSEFNMPWKQTTLGSVSSYAAYGMNSSAIEFDGVNKYIRITDIDDDTREFIPSPLTTPSGKLENQYLLNKGDIVFARTGASVGKSYLYKQKDGRLYFAGFLIKLTINKANPYFVYNQTLTEKYRKWIKVYSMRSGQPGINAEEYKEFEFAIPSLEEQTRIADFLSSVDERITLLNKQYDLLCRYKKGMMQKIFSQEVRFKDENGEEFPEWNSCQLKDVATRVTRKNKENNQTILTISGRDGLVDQMSYFNKQIASKNVIGYYLINNGEFAYNKSYSQGYPMGAIKMLTNYDRGVVSTLYICFKLNTNQSNSFYQHYFESGLQNRSIEKVAQEGARNHGLLNIGVNDFFDIELQIPSLKEQIKISDYLSALDDKIAAKKTELDKLKAWKQGLLQQMFI